MIGTIRHVVINKKERPFDQSVGEIAAVKRNASQMPRPRLNFCVRRTYRSLVSSPKVYSIHSAHFSVELGGKVGADVWR